MKDSVVYIVDDDGLMRRSLASLIEAEGYSAQTFSSGDEFLAYKLPRLPSCIILDLQMPGREGPAVQEHLSRLEWHPPVIFMTAHGTVPVTAKAMKAGAIDFLTKPFDPRVLLSAVSVALEESVRSLAKYDATETARELLNRLTPREMEVFHWVVSGKINKEIADVLGTTERTIKAHRSAVMQKLRAESVIDLVKIAEQAREV